MKVLHLIGGGELGGAEQHIITLLPRLQARGIQPRLGCLYKQSPLAEKIQSGTDIPTELFPMGSPMDLSPLPRLITYCTHHKIELIHSHGLRANMLGRAAGLFRKLPVITTWHSWPEGDFPSTRTGKLALRLEQATLGLSAGSIAVSQDLTHKLADWPPMRRRLQRTASPKKHKKKYPLQTIHNGYTPLERTPEEYAAARKRYRQQWNIPENATVLGSIGRLHPIKGHRYLLDAANRLTEHYPRLHLLLIGDGPDRSAIEDRLSNAPYTFTLTGHLPDAEHVLPAMDLFIFPSLHEGMGLVLLEAIQARLPIIASQTGGIPEVLRADTDALLVPPADSGALVSACRRLLDDPILRAALTTAAPERLTLFTPEKMADQTLSFYLGLTSSSC